MKSLKPIPTPLSVRWRDFRLRILPAIVLVTLCWVIGMLWQRVAERGTMLGVGEGVRSVAASPHPAVIEQWLVEPYTFVRQGTPVARLRPVDARADFDYVRSLLELERARAQPSMAEENAMNFERIRIEVLQTRTELAIARVKLELAERDVARNAPLHREKLLSEDIYEFSVNTRDALKAEVKEKGIALEEMEIRLERLRPIGEPRMIDRDTSSNLLTRLEQAQTSAAENLQPFTLLAPIDGMIGMPQRQAGEFVLAGEWLVTISSLRSDRIVGYMRQPYPIDPAPGMAVQVTTRTRKPQSFVSHIVQVGAHVEPITNALGFLQRGFMVDAGLPVIVHIPGEIDIRPGEMVGLTFRLSPLSSPPVPPPTRQIEAANRSAFVSETAGKKSAAGVQLANAPEGSFVICRGACDASAVASVGDDLFLAADDEDNVLRVYSRTRGGAPLHMLDFSRFAGVDPRWPEADVEGAAPLDGVVYWISSHARNKDGEERISRHRFFATTVVVTNKSLSVQPAGKPYVRLLSDLLGDARLARFNLDAAARLEPKAKGALNIEGLCATPEGHLLIGFRNPIPDGKALVVPLLNPADLIKGKTARFGEPALLDLGGLGVRSMARAEGRYYIVAGSYDGKGRSLLFEWRDGERLPRRMSHAGLDGLNPEGIECLSQEGVKRLLVVSDDGTLNIGGVECKEVKDPAMRYFRATTIGL